VIGCQEGLRLAGGDGVAGDRVGQTHLGLTFEGAELRCHRHGQASRVEPETELRREPACERETALDPGPLPPEQLGDGPRGELVVIGERRHHPGFIHGTRGPACGVCQEDAGLHGDSRNWFHHDGDFLPALALPDDQALEAVEDLEAAVRTLCNPQRHGGEVGPRIGMLSAQRGEGGPQLVEGDEEDKAHRFCASKGRT
jgi:hypothetical protein